MDALSPSVMFYDYPIKNSYKDEEISASADRLSLCIENSSFESTSEEDAMKCIEIVSFAQEHINVLTQDNQAKLKTLDKLVSSSKWKQEIKDPKVQDLISFLKIAVFEKDTFEADDLFDALLESPNPESVEKPCQEKKETEEPSSSFMQMTKEVFVSLQHEFSREILNDLLNKFKFLESIEKEKPEQIKTARLLTEIVSWYFSDYVMGNPEQSEDVVAWAMNSTISSLIEGIGPLFFQNVYEKRPKELTPNFKQQVIKILECANLFLEKYKSALKANCKTEEEFVTSFRSTLIPTTRMTQTRRENERKQMKEIFFHFSKGWEKTFSEKQKVYFEILERKIPSLMLSLVDTLFEDAIRIILIHRVCELFNIDAITDKSRKSLSKAEDKKLEKEIERDEKEMAEWLKEHEVFAKQIGKSGQNLIDRMINVAQFSEHLKVVSTIAGLFKTTIGKGILREARDFLKNDDVNQKLLLFKQLLWKFEDGKRIPLFADCFKKSKGDLQKIDENIQMRFEGQLYAKAMEFLEGKGISSWMIPTTVLKQLCDGFTKNIYPVFQMKGLLEILLKDYVYQALFTNSPRTSTMQSQSHPKSEDSLRLK